MSSCRTPAIRTAAREAEARERAPRVDLSACTSCWVCVIVCPAGAVSVAFAGDRAWVPSFDGGRCTRCFDCEMACPDGAIEVPFEIVEQERTQL